MTEAEWMECEDTVRMLEFLEGKASDRKFRLFACACCRAVWNRLLDRRLKVAVESCERVADGLKSLDSLAMGRLIATEALDEIHSDVSEQRWYYVEEYAAKLVHQTCRDELHPCVLIDILAFATDLAIYADNGNEAAARCREYNAQSNWLRDIFVNPFRLIIINPVWLAWNDGLLVSMARQMYDSRDFSDMPILADALEEAGCLDSDILNHCRQVGEHVRGCWVIDLLLGKS